MGKFFERIREQAREKGLLSDEHFTVDGTLIEAWASQKSFQPKGNGPQGPGEAGRNPDVDFSGKPRSNQTHQSTTDADARLMKKAPGSEARLGYMGHVLMENRNGLVVRQMLTIGSGTAERDAALAMLEALGGSRRITVGADKAYDVAGFVRHLRETRVTPHVAQKRRDSSIDARTVRLCGYQLSQRIRKRVEEVFGWLKTVGGHRKTRFRGAQRVAMHSRWRPPRTIWYESGTQRRKLSHRISTKGSLDAQNIRPSRKWHLAGSRRRRYEAPTLPIFNSLLI